MRFVCFTIFLPKTGSGKVKGTLNMAICMWEPRIKRGGGKFPGSYIFLFHLESLLRGMLALVAAAATESWLRTKECVHDTPSHSVKSGRKLWLIDLQAMKEHIGIRGHNLQDYNCSGCMFWCTLSIRV